MIVFLLLLSGCLGRLDIPKGDTATETAETGGDSSETGDSLETGGDTFGHSSDTSDTLDTSDTGTPPEITTVVYETTFGEKGNCTTAPFSRSDAGSMTYALYSFGSECGVYIFGAGGSSAPAVSIDASFSGFAVDTAYITEVSVTNILKNAITIYADFGGGSIVNVELGAGSENVLTVLGEADASGAATLRVWADSTTNYEGVVTSLVIGF